MQPPPPIEQRDDVVSEAVEQYRVGNLTFDRLCHQLERLFGESPSLGDSYYPGVSVAEVFADAKGSDQLRLLRLFNDVFPTTGVTDGRVAHGELLYHNLIGATLELAVASDVSGPLREAATRAVGNAGFLRTHPMVPNSLADALVPEGAAETLCNRALPGDNIVRDDGTDDSVNRGFENIDTGRKRESERTTAINALCVLATGHAPAIDALLVVTEYGSDATFDNAVVALRRGLQRWVDDRGVPPEDVPQRFAVGDVLTHEGRLLDDFSERVAAYRVVSQLEVLPPLPQRARLLFGV